MGGISWEDDDRRPLEDYWLGLTGTERPRVLVVPTAVADAADPTLAIVSQLQDRAQVSFVRFFPWPPARPAGARARAGRDLRHRREHRERARDLARARLRRDPARGLGGRRRPGRLERRDDLLVRGRRHRLVRPAARRHARRARLPAGQRVPALRRRGRAPAGLHAARRAKASRPGSPPTTASPFASTAPSWPRPSPRATARAPTASALRARSRSSRVGSSAAAARPCTSGRAPTGSRP